MRNLTLLTDFYQLTMMYGYFKNRKNRRFVFDLFYRKNPFGNGFAIFTGLEQVIEYIQNLKFTEEDLAYIQLQGFQDAEFIEYLRNFKFKGNLHAVPEGTAVFPSEPLIRVEANEIEAQLIETALLTIINHQTLIATKASRIREAAGDDIVMEFGLRRAQGPDAGLYGSRAAFIGGCNSTSNVLAGKEFGIPVKGTMAHSWVMSFDTELEAFRTYAKLYPDNCVLLVDTYDTEKSGIPNAIKVFQEMMNAGIIEQDYYYDDYRYPEHKPLPVFGIRLDSGDLAYLSKIAREMLVEAGFPHSVISVSNDLDENIIISLKQQGARVKIWGVGTKLITADGCPSLGGVYKLAAEIVDNKLIPKIKISENFEKITNPGIKQVYRIFDKKGMISADLITLEDEKFDSSEVLFLRDELHPWKRIKLQPGEYQIKPLLEPIFENGILVYQKPTINEIKLNAKANLKTLYDGYKRLINPSKMKVDLSDKLYDLKKDLLFQNKFN